MFLERSRRILAVIEVMELESSQATAASRGHLCVSQPLIGSLVHWLKLCQLLSAVNESRIKSIPILGMTENP